MLSEKKFFSMPGKGTISIDYIKTFVEKFSKYFRAHRFDNTETAVKYILGLLKCPKGEANMERMEEEIDQSEYRAYQQFITNSTWDCEGLLESVAIETSEILLSQKKENRMPIGYIIDESGHLKKGEKSVGVSRQYAGVAGKVDNCQVGVYASLVNGKHASIINERIFLPASWTTEKARCQEAGIPLECQSFKTKPQLAAEMLKQDIARSVAFDWIGGDGLYGHSFELCKTIDEMNKFFVLDVHKDEKVFLEEPVFEVPEKKSKKGKTPEKLKPNVKDIRLDRIAEQIPEQDWHLEDIRHTVKGILKVKVYKINVWSWDGESAKATRRTLIITQTADKTKYSFSNGQLSDYTHKEYGYFVCQRYWVERTFDNAKNELGMSDYQIRKWKSWHHHHSLVMLASLFIMKQEIDNHHQIPLLSFRDARILVILQVFGSAKEVEKRLKQMKKRHIKRQADIDFNYRKQAEKAKNLSS